MPEDEDRNANVGRVLRRVLKRVDPEAPFALFDVWSFWDELVGEALARRAQPSGYRNGVLFVTVGAHAWMQELQFMKKALRNRLNERLGSELIREIELVSGVVDRPAAASEMPTVADSPKTTDAEVALPELSDPELAATFQRLVRAHARLGRRRKKPQGR